MHLPKVILPIACLSSLWTLAAAKCQPVSSSVTSSTSLSTTWSTSSETSLSSSLSSSSSCGVTIATFYSTITITPTQTVYSTETVQDNVDSLTLLSTTPALETLVDSTETGYTTILATQIDTDTLTSTEYISVTATAYETILTSIFSTFAAESTIYITPTTTSIFSSTVTQEETKTNSITVTYGVTTIFATPAPGITPRRRRDSFLQRKVPDILPFDGNQPIPSLVKRSLIPSTSSDCSAQSTATVTIFETASPISITSTAIQTGAPLTSYFSSTVVQTSTIQIEASTLLVSTETEDLTTSIEGPSATSSYNVIVSTTNTITVTDIGTVTSTSTLTAPEVTEFSPIVVTIEATQATSNATVTVKSTVAIPVPTQCTSGLTCRGGANIEGSVNFFNISPDQPLNNTNLQEVTMNQNCCALCYFTPGCIFWAVIEGADVCQFLTLNSNTGINVDSTCPDGQLSTITIATDPGPLCAGAGPCAAPGT